MHWRRKWQPTPVFLPGESQGRGTWWAAVYGVAQSRTQLKWLSMHARSYQICNSMLSPKTMHRPKKSCYRKTVPIDLLNTCLHACPSSCLTLCNPMGCSLPCSSVHGIFQAKIMKWVAIFSSRRTSWPRDWTCVSCIASGFFTAEPSGLL